jgi:Flp pilus assembly pilin Flp
MRTPLYGLAWLSAFVATATDPQARRHDERGAAFTEYVVLLAVIVAVVVGLLWTLRTPLVNAINGVVSALGGAGTPPATP